MLTRMTVAPEIPSVDSPACFATGATPGAAGAQPVGSEALKASGQNAPDFSVLPQLAQTVGLRASPASANIPTNSSSTSDQSATAMGSASQKDIAGSPSGIAIQVVSATSETAEPASALPPTGQPSGPAIDSANTTAPLPATSYFPGLPASQSGTVPTNPFAPTSATPQSPIPGATEKNAGSLQPPTPGQATTPSDGSAQLDSDIVLGTAMQRVKLAARSVGITSAERPADMRKPAETSVPARLESTSGMDVSPVAPLPAGGAVPAAPSRSPSESTAALVSHAAAAVEATLDAAEHARDAIRSSVELSLSLGDDTRLAVRVELREGTIQTTFRTDSAELRQALANEWRQTAPSILATAPGQTSRVAEPIFAPVTGSPDFTGTSTGSHANFRQATPPTPADSSSLPSSPTGPRNSSPSAAVATGPRRLPTSLRLNAFA